MSKKCTYPRSIVVGSATVKLYRVNHAHSASGYLYTVVWYEANKRKYRQFADEAEGEKEARLIGSKVAGGHVEAAGLTSKDRDELLALRALARGGVPVMTAMAEWAKAWELTGGRVLDACSAFAAANGSKGFTAILAPAAVTAFKKAMTAQGTDAERVYGSKLSRVETHFVGRDLHAISTAEWQQYLAYWTDGVSHNDIRKRTITLCRWAQRQGYISRGVELEISRTDKKKEKEPEVGIIKPDTFGQLLHYLRTYHPHYLAAAVIAGFTGVRSDEIHGKRDDHREKRQLWSDIHFDEKEPLLVVSNVKENTPSWRTLPLCGTAVEWLKLCTNRDGYVCDKAAMERVREIGINAGLKLPDNCFRHSYISYQVIRTGNKHQVAAGAGTSVERIDKNYRRPIFAETGEVIDVVVTKPITKDIANGWFEMTPEAAAALPHLQQKTPAENGRLGGLVKSEAKTRAASLSAGKARLSRPPACSSESNS